MIGFFGFGGEDVDIIVNRLLLHMFLLVGVRFCILLREERTSVFRRVNRP